LRILFDTSVVIRLGTQPELVSKAVIERLIDADSVFVTPIARAEIAIKVSIGKLLLPETEDAYWSNFVASFQAVELPFVATHAARLSGMPLYHRDPFDRMIAAQCIAEDLFLATTDRMFESYGVKVLS
jgi:PIN domain nuclease of toxin-antitoxin system